MGRDLCAYEAKTPVRFLQDGTILIGDEGVEPAGCLPRARRNRL
jgi:hypothetical protein